MKIEVEERINVVEGRHEGVIIDVKYRTKPYAYTDVVIEIAVDDDKSVTLTAGYPTCVTESSKLGNLLHRFGGHLIVGESIDPNKVLVGQKCKFLVEEEKTDKGTFSNIISKSVKPWLVDTSE